MIGFMEDEELGRTLLFEKKLMSKEVNLD